MANNTLHPLVPCCSTASERAEELAALLALLSDEAAAGAFARLSSFQQSVIFGAMETMALSACAALTDAEAAHG
ncbi:hypothetical protein [Caballeronia sp. BCC1704]|uniref:hypothetical protein n=1 Tax=Caballeronia sp. BCC1704 TaxID=2676300 RepID=UPI00158DB2A6|nr:hypothetical protein [Caballeronia sp. BCC1704]